MIIISVIKGFVITIIITFSCLPSFVASNALHSVDGIQSFSSSSHGQHPEAKRWPTLGSENYPIAAKITSDSVGKGSCSTKSECSHHSYCDSQTHRCKCNSDYINVENLMNGTKIKHSVPTCLPVAKLNEKCLSHEQCLVRNSFCMNVDALMNLESTRNLPYYCKCKEGYHQEEREEVIRIENQKINNNPVCGEFVSMGNSWIGTFAIVCIMLLIVIIGCFVGIIRFQRWKQRPLSSTVTSLSADNRHTSHHMSSSPPPMGSVEAEFQNDFIQVFPMHHLEPLPDKNTNHDYIN